MDTEQAKKELSAILEEGAYIYFANIIEQSKIFYKDIDTFFQDLSKRPLNIIPKALLEQILNDPLEDLSEKKYQEISRALLKTFLDDSSKKIITPKKAYQTWYDNALEILHILRPRRLEDFEELYTGNKNRDPSKDLTPDTAGIKHYLQGFSMQKDNIKTDCFSVFISNFTMQATILASIAETVDNDLFNLEKNIEHKIYKSEMDTAKELKKNGHLGSAGALAGLVIERHLKTLVAKRKIPIKTQKNKPPTMDDYNNALKKDDAYDTATWRLIQRCGDIRNDCAHSNEDKPTKEETDDIIRAAEQIIADYN